MYASAQQLLKQREIQVGKQLSDQQVKDAAIKTLRAALNALEADVAIATVAEPAPEARAEEKAARQHDLAAAVVYRMTMRFETVDNVVDPLGAGRSRGADRTTDTFVDDLERALADVPGSPTEDPEVPAESAVVGHGGDPAVQRAHFIEARAYQLHREDGSHDPDANWYQAEAEFELLCQGEAAALREASSGSEVELMQQAPAATGAADFFYSGASGQGLPPAQPGQAAVMRAHTQ